MNVPIRNLYYLLAYAWGHADAAHDREADAADIEALPDLLAVVLAQRVAALLRRGLDRNYVEEEVVLEGVRGKLDLAATVKRSLLLQLQTACTVEEFRHDVLHNQIIRSTLRSLLGLGELSRDVREEVGLVYRRLQDISEIKLSRTRFRRVRIHRNNRAYGFVIHLCRLIHESLLLEEDGSARFVDIRGDRGAMARLFEDFVAEFYRVEQAQYQVTKQSRLRWHGAESAEERDLDRLPTMQPDVVLMAPDRRIILDTKFYQEPLSEGRFGKLKIRSGHLYQVFAYIENRNAQKPDGPPHEGVLLYPVVEDAFRFDYHLKGHRVQVRTIDLDQDWRQIRADLLEMLFDDPAAGRSNEALAGKVAL